MSCSGQKERSVHINSSITKSRVVGQFKEKTRVFVQVLSDNQVSEACLRQGGDDVTWIRMRYNPPGSSISVIPSLHSQTFTLVIPVQSERAETQK